MPAQTSCPISEVDRALLSYINSREDTLRIRRTISKYLISSLRPVTAATQSQHLNHECPSQSLSAANTNPPGLKDARLEYLQALRARAKAQTKHRELQASLEQLRGRHVDDNPTQPDSNQDDNVTQGYVALLRQRRRHAELQVIQESLDKLLTAKPSTASSDPRDLVKRVIGDQPDIPAERLEHLSQAGTEDDQAWVFKLKQEVLEARASLERTQAAKEKAQENKPADTPLLQSQVFALEQARNELVDWVQGELAKLEEESMFLEDASPIKRPPPVSNTNGTTPTLSKQDLASATDRIKAAYDTYTSARATLLSTHISLQTPVPIEANDSSSSAIQTRNSSPDTAAAAVPTPPANPLSKLFPYLPHLAHLANSERALVQQSVFLAANLAAADQEAQEALVRLSGESHLLPQGSKEAGAWGRAATEAEAETEKLVREKLEESRKEMASVGMVVELCSLQSRVLDAM